MRGHTALRSAEILGLRGFASCMANVEDLKRARPNPIVDPIGVGRHELDADPGLVRDRAHEGVLREKIDGMSNA
jgi:hypothetical protein